MTRQGKIDDVQKTLSLNQILDDKILRESGFNLQGVLDIDPDLDPDIGYAQLLIFAAAGRQLWEQVPFKEGSDPIDRFSVRRVSDFLARAGCDDFSILYPSVGDVLGIQAIDLPAIDLRAIGRRLGWHHESPLGIGIHPEFGTWFAYRVVIAANTQFAATQLVTPPPCAACLDKPCVANCPASAVKAAFPFNLESCRTERLREAGQCQLACFARSACPVGKQYQYHKAQLNYHYGHSLDSIKRIQ